MSQNPKPAPLGRGLSALFGDADTSYQAPQKTNVVQVPHADAAAPKNSPTRMPLTWLQPGTFQPRRMFDDDALKGLANSIKERGILEPLLVRAVIGKKDMYEIIAGERRWRAAQLAGLHEVPVLLREITDLEALEFGLIENIQRQDLSPLEEAEGYSRLLEEFGHTQEALAKIVGKSRPHITNMLRLLSLPPAVKQMIDKGELTTGHARAIITASDPLALAKEIVQKGLNVRQAEALAKPPERLDTKPTVFKKIAAAENADVAMLEKELTRAVGLRVKVDTQGDKGSMTIYYNDLDQLDGIIKKLKG